MNIFQSKKLLLLASLGLLASVVFFTGCVTGRRTLQAVDLNLSENRLVDVTITWRVTGRKDYYFLSLPEKTYFLEGYIQGKLTDYLDSPIAGVPVYAALEEEVAAALPGLPEETVPIPFSGAASREAPAIKSAVFDPAVTDTKGTYRIRFSMPIYDGKVDVKGILYYNPGWAQELSRLGKTYEPQVKQSRFRLYYGHKDGVIGLSDEAHRVIVNPLVNVETKTAPLPGAQAPVPAIRKEAPKPAPAPAARPAPETEDLFKAFGFPP